MHPQYREDDGYGGHDTRNDPRQQRYYSNERGVSEDHAAWTDDLSTEDHSDMSEDGGFVNQADMNVDPTYIYRTGPLGDQTLDFDDGDTPKASYVPWTADEDVRLTAVVSELRAKGESDEPENTKDGATAKSKFWTNVSLQIQGRTAKQCRERWKNSLDPNIAHSPWTIEEDLMLQKIQAELGNKWSQIAANMPGRTENGVKGRFKSIIRAKRRQWTSQEDALLLQLYRQHGPKWSIIQSNLSKRTLHGVKVRYRALISGSTQKSVVLGSPEQSLPYDYRTYFEKRTLPKALPLSSEALSTGETKTPISQKNTIAATSVPSASTCKNVPVRPKNFVGVLGQKDETTSRITKKRVLIESLMSDYPDEEDFRGRHRLASGPSIIPGFTASSLRNSDIHDYPSPNVAPTSVRVDSQTLQFFRPAASGATQNKHAPLKPMFSRPGSVDDLQWRRNGPIKSLKSEEGLRAQAPGTVAWRDGSSSSELAVHPEKKLVGPSFPSKRFNGHNDEFADFPSSDHGFASKMSDILMSAKSHAEGEEIDMNDYQDFQSSFEDILNESGPVALF